MLDSKSDSVHSTKTSLPELSYSSNVKRDECFPLYLMLFLGIKHEHLAEAAVQAELKQNGLLTPNTSVYFHCSTSIAREKVSILSGQ